MTKILTNTPRAGETAEQTASRKDRGARPEAGVSRRTLLGALAAAPVAVPALAREMAASSVHASRVSLGGCVGEDGIPIFTQLKLSPASYASHIRLRYGDDDEIRRWSDLPPVPGGDRPVEAPDEILQIDGLLTPEEYADMKQDFVLRSAAPFSPPVPNNLFGSYINEEGEAC